MSTNVQNRVAEIRKQRGVSASELARRVSVSRQTVYAIEAGTYVPNTEVALNLARELEVPVDELFSLRDSGPAAPETVAAEVLSAGPIEKGQAVRVCQVGSRWVSVPVTAAPYYMPEADGIVDRPRGTARADLVMFSKEDAAQKRLLLAGCDPATGLLSRMVERASGVEVVSAAAASRLALNWLRDGKVHIAGSHLEDPDSGEFNLPYLRSEFPGEEFAVVTFARWEEGLVVRAESPLGIRGIADLARPDVRFVNREPGSGSRALLDRLLAGKGIEAARVDGYQRIAYGHLAAAYSIVTGEADVCLATRSAAKAFGLGFLPLHTDRYDLVLRRQTLEMPAVQAFLDVLQRSSLRRKLEALAGYDTSQTGALIA